MTQLGSNVRIGNNARLGVNSLFSPLWISDCVAWFDMLDPRSYTVTSGAVTKIINKASGVAWTESLLPPYYSATGFNGYPCMVGDGATSSARIISTESAVVNALANNNPGSVFIVAQANIADDATAALGCGHSAVSNSSTKRYGINTGGAGEVAIMTVDNAGVSVNLASNTGVTDTNCDLYEYSYSNTAGSLGLNGELIGANGFPYAPSTLTPNRVAIGCRPDSAPDQFWNGKIAEILIFNRELSEYERALVRVYLMRKWRIQDTTPQTILGGLAWWLRADKGITIATGVSQWNDLSGNGVNFTQATAANQPTFVSNAINGCPAVRGDGVNDLLSATFPRSAPGTQPFYIWMIYKGVGFTSNDCIIGDFSGAGMVCKQTGTTSIFMYNNVTSNVNGGVPATGTYGRIEWQFQNSTSDYSKCGATVVTGQSAGNAAGAGTLQIFSSGASAAPANIEIAEAFWFLGTPSAYRRAYLDAYAYLRYGPTLLV
jgi:hypothetical protein